MLDLPLFAIVTPILLIVMMFFERLVNAVLYLVVSVVFNKEGGGVYPAMQFYGSILGSGLQSFAALFDFVLVVIRAVSTSVAWIIVLFSVITIVFFFYEQAPGTVRGFVIEWNYWIGPMLYYTVIWPVRIVSMLFENLLPLYNFAVRITVDIFVSVSFTTVTQFGSELLDLATNIGIFVTLFTKSFLDFVFTVDNKVQDCASIGRECFELTEWDLKPALSFAAPITRNGVAMMMGMCPVFAVPLDLLVYPLTDPNVPAAVSGGVNMFLKTFVEMPRVTAQRCRLHKDDIGVVACLPDLQRLYEHFAATARLFGQIVDNWMDMSLVILEAAINRQTTVCAETQKLNQTISFSQTYFAKNVTTIVTLKPSLFAITDGSNIQYVDAGRTMDSVISPLGMGWPIQVDASLGVAAVESLNGGGEYISMLGCRCEDIAGEMRITCAIAPHFEQQAADAPQMVIDVLFQVPATASVMTCARSKISVQSLRWPSVRYTAVNEAPELVAKRRVDAAIWVMPLCLGAGISCSENAIVTSCYPYCLALHERASPSHKMVLYDAQQWEEYVHIFGRDCAMQGSGGLFASLSNKADSAARMGSETMATSVDLGIISSAVNMLTSGETLTCVANPLAHSVVPSRLHASAAYSESVNSVRTSEQPFVVAGDIALVGNYDFENSEYSVTAFRIFGNSRNEFTIQPIADAIPANPPVETLEGYVGILNGIEADPNGKFVPEGEPATSFSSDRFTLPYRFSSSAFGLYPAVQSPTGVVFATNPTLHLWKAFFEYCAHGGSDAARTQLMTLSSYHPLMITAVTVSTNKIEFAGVVFFNLEGDGGMSFEDGITASMCTDIFAVAVTNLEIIDEMNIAASVLYTTIDAGLDPFTDPRTHTRIYYINTRTMEKRRDEPWIAPNPRQPSDAAIQLCPALRRMPQFGSLGAEGLVAGAVLVKTVLDTPLVIAGLVPHWKDTVACPLESYGHTTLQRCGDELFSFVDEFFEAVTEMNGHYWRSLAYLANLIPSQRISSALTGTYYLGNNRLRPFLRGTAFQVVNTGQGNTIGKMGGLMKAAMGMFSPTNIFGFLQGAVLNQITWAWFTGRVLSRALADVIPEAVHGDVTGGLNALWENVYESRGTFSNMVIRDGMVGCSGMGMVAGGTSPFARFLVYSCEAPLRMIEGTLDFVLTATVDTGFAACVCYASDGHDFSEYVRERCLPSAPKHLQPVLVNMLNGYVAPSAMCEQLRGELKSRLERAMDPTFTAMYAASEQVGFVLDWFRTWVGADDGGQCLDFDTDPYVAAIIPEPVDYFRVCGQTEACELRCAGAIANFEAAKAVDGLGLEDDVFTEEVEGLFFTEESLQSMSPFRAILALYESLECVGAQMDVSRCGKCVYALGVREETIDIAVGVYCVPVAVGMGIFQVHEWVVTGVAGSTASMGVFLDERRVLLVNAVKGEHSSAAAAFLAESMDSSTVSVSILGLPVPDVLRISDLIVNGNDVFMRYVAGDGSTRKVCLKVIFATFASEAARFDPPGGMDCSDLADRLWGNHVVWLIDGAALLVPSLPSIEAQAVWVVDIDFSSGVVLEQEKVGTVRNFAVASGVADFYKALDRQKEIARTPRLLAQNSLSQLSASVFSILSAEDSATHVNWLAEVRLDSLPGGRLAVQRAYSRKQAMTVRVERTCDRLSCSGCYKRQTQVACYVMQQCIVGSCVGTLVNQRRPLCAVGMTIKATMDTAIQAMQGSYMIMAQTAGEVLQLVLRDTNSFEVTWPDEAFFGLLCTSKDAIAHSTSVITATINGMVQTVLGLPIQSLGEGGTSVDGNLRATATMATQALNQLLFQIAILPLYGAIVVQKMIVCQTSSLLAFADVLGVEVKFGNEDLRSTTSANMGTCLPDGVSADVSARGEQQQKPGLAKVAADISSDFFATTSLGASVTTIDAGIAYIKGVLTGMEDVAQAFDMAHCKMPDFYMSDVFECVCGDKPLAIPRVRSTESVAESAFWCTGTLQMIGTNGEPFIVFNRHSLEEIEAVMASTLGVPPSTSGKVYSALDRYLLCLSRPVTYEAEFGQRERCANLRPSILDLERQDVDTIAVMGRCRANYQLKEWDPGAYALFVDDIPKPDALYALSAANKQVGECLVTAHKLAQGPAGCLDAFLSSFVDARYPQQVGISKDVYFSYEFLSTEANSASIDACMVFSGPAETNEHFAACLDRGGQSCEIAPFVWSARSNNKVPVAVRHKRTGAVDADVAEQADAQLQDAYEAMHDAFTRADAWATADNDHITAALFSAEGDYIHQLFDCAFMGALPRADLWPLRELGLPVPSWWRNEDGSRPFQTCGREELGDDDALPFTCGSETRRAVMKYFVRDFFTGNTSASEVVVEVIQEAIAELKKAYAFDAAAATADLESLYACKCSGEERRAYECCVGAPVENYTTEGLNGARFDIVSPDIIAEALTDRMVLFWEKKLRSTDADPWWKHLNAEEQAKWQWTDSEVYSKIAARAGLYSPTSDLFFFNATETTGPFNRGTEGLWQMCTGLLGQHMSTLPLKSNSTGWFLRETDSLEYDGVTGDLRAFARSVLRHIDKESPVSAMRDWRHIPSQSAICKKSMPGADETFPAHKAPGRLQLSESPKPWIGLSVNISQEAKVWGLGMFRLGDVVECFCGWAHPVNDSLCRMHPDIAAHLGVSQDFARSENADITERVLMENELSLAGKCPALDMSDLWGILPPTSLKTWSAWKPGDVRQIPTVEVIAYGRAGLRIEAWERLVQSSGFALEESLRVKKLVADDGWDLATQPFCASESSPPVDDINFFPVVQIVQQSMPIAACSRYVIEGAKLRVLSDNLGDNVLAVIAQQIVADSWEKRCNAQLHLLSTCQHMHVFEFIPDYVPEAQCPFSISGDTTDLYVTAPGCVVYSKQNDAFYDPCNYFDCTIAGLELSTHILFADAAKLWFDPRSLARGWGQTVPEVFIDALLDRVRDDQKEGAEFEANEYCDAFVDWWPEAWEHPVGYHVTTPCHPEEAGYRTFDSAFKIRRDMGGVNPRVKFEPTALRDPVLGAAHFGTGGVCRKSTYGFPLFELNDLRLCTRADTEVRFDPLVDNTLHSSSAAASDATLLCAATASAVPWHMAEGQLLPAHYRSIGTIPALLGGTRPVAYLPRAGIVQDSGTSFYTRPGCTSDVECGVVGRCRRGVCFPDSVQCVQHSECPGTDVCSADGACVSASVYVRNLLDDETNINVEVFAYSCGDDDIGFDMYAKSRYGQIDRLLPAHGFCGAHEWYDYTRMCPGDTGTCEHNGITTKWLNSTSADDSIMFKSGVLKLVPHPCDRDYQYSAYRRACTAVGGDAPSSNFFRTYNRDLHVEQFVDTKAMSDTGDLPFLGLENADWKQIKPCTDVPQCVPIEFTVNGQKHDRYDQDDLYTCGGGMKRQADGNCQFDFETVPFAHQLCVEPQKTLEVCNANKDAPLIDEDAVAVACTSLMRERSPIETRLQGSASVANALFGVFLPVKLTPAGYTAAVECGEKLRTEQPFIGTEQSRSLYFAFEHSLYEFPFSWWFKCSFLSNAPVLETNLMISCDAWEDPTASGIPWWLGDTLYYFNKDAADSFAETALKEFFDAMQTNDGFRLYMSNGDVSIMCSEKKIYKNSGYPAQCLNKKYIADLDCYELDLEDNTFNFLCDFPDDSPENCGFVKASGEKSELSKFYLMDFIRDLFVVHDFSEDAFSGDAVVDKHVYSIQVDDGMSKQDFENWVLSKWPVDFDLCIPSRDVPFSFNKDDYHTMTFMFATEIRNLFPSALLRSYKIQQTGIDSKDIIKEGEWSNVLSKWTADYITGATNSFNFGSVTCCQRQDVRDTVKALDFESGYAVNDPFRRNTNAIYLPCRPEYTDVVNSQTQEYCAAIDKSQLDFDNYRQSFPWQWSYAYRCFAPNTGARTHVQKNEESSTWEMFVQAECYGSFQTSPETEDPSKHFYTHEMVPGFKKELEFDSDNWSRDSSSTASPVYDYGIRVIEAEEVKYTIWYGNGNERNCEAIASHLTKSCICYFSAEERGVRDDTPDLTQNRLQYSVPILWVNEKYCDGYNDCEWKIGEEELGGGADAIVKGFRKYIRRIIESGYVESIQENLPQINDWYMQLRESLIYAHRGDPFERDFVVDTARHRLHEYFLEKDMDGFVLCTNASAAEIDYEQCDNHERLTRLYDYVMSNYIDTSKHVGDCLPHSELFYSGMNLLSGVVVAWAAKDSLPASHVSTLLSPEAVEALCATGLSVMLDAYCHVEGDVVTVMNPWLGGHYNPYEGCDTIRQGLALEMIDGDCDPATCVLPEELEDFSDFMPAGDKCLSNNGRLVDKYNTATSKLCERGTVFADAECQAHFGTLGGGIGTPVSTVYGYSDFVCSDSTASFFTSTGVNMLFGSETIDNACLQFGNDEVGPHSVWLELESDGRLFARGAKMSADTDADTRNWMYTLQEDCADNAYGYDLVYAGKNWTFSTPYERIAFWQGLHPRKPMVPDPSRTHAAFSDAHGGCGKAHPLQSAKQVECFNGITTPLRTPDGICFCEEMRCASCNDANAAAAAFSVPNEATTPTRVEVDSSSDFYDWPHVPGAFRDGGAAKASSQCWSNRVVSRLPSFFAGVTKTAAPTAKRTAGGRTTLSEGGDCHMGRAARDDNDKMPGDLCFLVEKTAESFVFECTVESDGSVYHFTLPREASRKPPAASAAMRILRKKCSQCSVPGFESEGELREAESSFGVPFRFAPSRRVMRELKWLMAEYNISETWGSADDEVSRREFVENVLRPAAHAAVLDNREELLAEMRALFEQPWVFCNNKECSGSIAFDDWVAASPAGRLSMCKDELLAQSDGGGDLVVEMELCDVDATLDEVCSSLRMANQSIFDANCHAAGLCLPDLFAYAPAVYSMSNNDFARMSVRNFYLRHDTDVCPATRADEEKLREQNEQEQQDCASMLIRVFNEAMSQLRLVAHTIARTQLYVFNVITSLFRTILPSAAESAMRDLTYWFNKLIHEVKKIVLEVAQLIFKLTFNMSTFGQIVRDVLKELCKWLSWLLDKVAILWCNVVDPVIDVLIKIVNSIATEIENAINSIPMVSGFKFTVLRGFISLLQDFLTTLSDFMCSGEQFNCDWLDIEADEDVSGALPAATRCWADFVPFAGISSTLSCSRADTCVLEEFGSEKVVCDACPAQDGTTFNDFGCNLLTKRCSCKTQPRQMTYCSESAQCSLDATCLLVDSPFASAAWGVDLCAACSSGPVCVFDGDESIGRCACPFQAPRMELCDELSSTPFLQPTSASVCYYTFSSSIQTGAVTSVSSASLSLVPCSIVDPTAVVCIDVNGVLSSVAFRLVSAATPGRRLMAMPVVDFLRENGAPGANEQLAETIMQFADWNRTAEPCRSLVLAHRQEFPLGPVDTYALKHCVFWRIVGNLTRGVPDTLFLSLEDAIEAVSNDPAVLLEAVKSFGDTVHTVLALWPAARNFLAHLAPLLDGRNNSWLVLARDVSAGSTHRRVPDANWETFKHMSAQHTARRLLADTPRIEDVSELTIGVHKAHKQKQFAAAALENGVAEDITFEEVDGIVNSMSLFSAIGFDDFLQSRQEDPSFSTAEYWVDADSDGNLDWNTCPVAAIVAKEVKEGLALVRQFYSGGMVRLEPSQLMNLTAAMPLFMTLNNTMTINAQGNTTATSMGAVIVSYIASMFSSVTGMHAGKLGAMLQCNDNPNSFSLCNMLRDYFTCDQEAVQLCTKRTHTLYLGIPICGLLFVLVSYMLNALGLGSLSIWLWLSFPGFVAWYTYGYSSSCMPMVPTCLSEDVLLPLYFFVPRKLRVSEALQTVPGCWNDKTVPASECFRSCATDPIFNYQSLSATYAQLICEMYGDACYQPAVFTPPPWLSWLIDPVQFNVDLYNKYQAQWNVYNMQPPRDDELTAQRFCFFAGLMYATPYLVVFSALFLVVVAVPALVTRLLVIAVQVLLQMVFYSHMSTGGDI